MSSFACPLFPFINVFLHFHISLSLHFSSSLLHLSFPLYSFYPPPFLFFVLIAFPHPDPNVPPFFFFFSFKGLKIQDWSPTKGTSRCGPWCWVMSRGRAQRQPTEWDLSVAVATVNQSFHTVFLWLRNTEIFN